MIGSSIVAPLVGANANRLGARLIFAVGLALLAVGFLLLTRITPVSDWDALLAGLIIAGIGGAAVQAQLTTAAVSAAPRERAGLATGISATMRQVGSSMGIALLGSIFTSSLCTLPAECTRGGAGAEGVRGPARAGHGR